MAQLLDENVFAEVLRADKSWDAESYFNELYFSHAGLEITGREKIAGQTNVNGTLCA